MIYFSWVLLASAVAGFLSAEAYNYLFDAKFGHWPEYIVTSVVGGGVAILCMNHRYGSTHFDLANLRCSDLFKLIDEQQMDRFQLIERSMEALQVSQDRMIDESQMRRENITQVISQRMALMMGDLDEQDWGNTVTDLGAIENMIEAEYQLLRDSNDNFHLLLQQHQNNVMEFNKDLLGVIGKVRSEVHRIEKKLM